MGPMTGRAAGYCAGFGVPGYMNPVPYGGFGGRWAPGAYSPATQVMPMAPYGYAPGYASGYAPAWPQAMGWRGRGFGRGRGRGFGRGRGWGRGFGW